MPAPQGGTLADAIASPLSVVRQLFQHAGQPGGGDDDWGVEAHFRGLMEDPAALEQVPLLTAETIDQIPNNSLCRYRGMVQDMMDPEYYVGAFRRPGGDWATAKFADSAPEAIPADVETCVWDRKPVYCTAIPGASAWSLPAQPAQAQSATTAPTPQPAPATAAGKRAREEETGEDTTMEDAEPAAAAKAPRSEAPAAAAREAPPPAPFPEPRAGDCLVFLYGREEGAKLNEPIEVVGVLSRLPERAQPALQLAGRAGEKLDWMEEEAAAIPPTSLVPRLHALATARHTGGEGLPLIPCKDAAQRRQQVAALRAAALDRLAAALCGDRLAAEYLLLQLTARVHTRPEGGATALGLFSLGLTNCPAGEPAPAAAGDAPPLGSPELLSPFGRGVLAALAGLHPRVVGLPLSVAELNRRSWRPARDLKSGRLLAAPLQLAEGTQVLLDETRLRAGQLTALGVANLKALQRLAEEQSVEYDFGFYQLPMPADAPLLMLSVGRPLLHASVAVSLPLQPLAQPGEAPAQPEELLRPVRAYLALVRRLEFAVPQPVTAFLEEQLVAARKEDPSLQPPTMHTWLTLARLLALSHGDDELSREHWTEMRRLEHLREQRLRAAK